MNLLILGGTRFLGRHLVEAALARGHCVATFNRGTRPGLWPGVEELRGDRSAGDVGLAALRGRRWDAALDTCGYVPRVVGAATRCLRAAVSHYVFVSSISVYADVAAGPDESSAVAQLADPESDDVQRNYGALKAACERVVREAFGERALIVRPGLIAGPFDPTGRFTYWPLRLARGGEVLAPADPAAPVQLIDVRDLARWIVELVERGVGGTFNATGPAGPLRFDEMLARGARALGARCSFTWVDGDFLQSQGVQPWTQLPLWVPASDAWLHRTKIEQALAAGLSFTDLERTFGDVLVWARQHARENGPGSLGSAGLSAEREAEVLAAWAATTG